MGTKTVGKSSKFARYMKVPVRVLARARDFYVRSLSGCAGGHESYGSVMGMGMGCAAPQLGNSLPKSFSGNSVSYASRDEDLRELIRIASTRSLAGKAQGAKPSSPGGEVAVQAVRRSRTVAIGRIDEEKPCEFGGETAEVVYPRSRSLEVASR